MTPVLRRFSGAVLVLALAAAVTMTVKHSAAQRRGAELEREVAELRRRGAELEALLQGGELEREGLAEEQARLASRVQELERYERYAPYLAAETFRGNQGGFGTRYRLRAGAVTPTPDARESPYDDCLVVLQATVLEAGPSEPERRPDVVLAAGDEVLLTVWGFQARQPAVALEKGDVIWCTLLDPGSVDESVREIQVVDAIGNFELPSYLACGISVDEKAAPARAIVQDALIRPGTSRAEAIQLVRGRVLEELRQHAATWDDWYASLAPFREAVLRLRAEHAPEKTKGKSGGIRLPDRDGAWFEIYSNHLLVGPAGQPLPDGRGAGTPPPENSAVSVVASVSEQLARHGIDLIFVPINLKSAVYPEKILFDHLDVIPADGIVDPQWRRFVAELCEAGVEVVDLLPFLLEAKARGGDLLYLHDHHWSPRTIEIAADLVAQRLQRYDFAREAGQEARYRLQRGMLRSGQGIMAANSVLSAHDGEAYVDDPDSVILVAGDSNLQIGAGTSNRIRSSVDGGNGSFAAHLALRMNMPVAAGGRLLIEDGRIAHAPSALFHGRRVLVMVTMMTRFSVDTAMVPLRLPERLFTKKR